jgi:hypothetical protein
MIKMVKLIVVVVLIFLLTPFVYSVSSPGAGAVVVGSFGSSGHHHGGRFSHSEINKCNMNNDNLSYFDCYDKIKEEQGVSKANKSLLYDIILLMLVLMTLYPLGLIVYHLNKEKQKE